MQSSWSRKQLKQHEESSTFAHGFTRHRAVVCAFSTLWSAWVLYFYMKTPMATQLPKTKTNPATDVLAVSKPRFKKDGTPRKAPVDSSKLIKQGTYMTVASKKNPSREAKVELWEIWLPNWKGEITHRGYQVNAETRLWYYGPCFYDKLTDKNSCLAMATRRFENPNAESVYA